MPTLYQRLDEARELDGQRLSHSADDLLVVGKAEPVFLSHYVFANPDGKLSAPARNEIYFGDTEFLLEQVRHPGGARQVVSNHAIAYGNFFHLSHPPSKKFRILAQTGISVLKRFYHGRGESSGAGGRSAATGRGAET